uniref:Uncharacterized protein n=1 Tax=Anguilla anguilla TaxID=7936 RepID=A0A0E9SAV0_ANGAN
MIDALPSGL